MHVFVAVLCLSCAGVHQRIGDTPRRVFVAVADDSMDAKPEDADADAWIEEEARSLGLDDMSEATMSKLFQWAIENSDPSKLESQAKRGLSEEEMVAKRMRMKRVLKELDMRPTEGQLMRDVIEGMQARGQNVTEAEVENEVFSLEVLQELVEPIDNANDLDKMGGLDEVIVRTASKHATIRAAAYQVIGTASSNNDMVQKQILDKGALHQFARQLQVETDVDVRVKAIFAIGVVSRNSETARQVLYDENLLELLLDLMDTDDTRLRRKSVLLLTDFFSRDPQAFFAKITALDNLVRPLVAIVAGTREDDLDLREKAMIALQSMLLLPQEVANTVDAIRGSDIARAMATLARDLDVAEAEDDSLAEYFADIRAYIVDISKILDGSVSGEL